MIRNLLILFASFLLAGPAFATTSTTANCDSDIGLLPYQKGRFQTAVCKNLCNKVIATDTVCTELDFNSYGMPDLIVLEREENSGACSDPGGPTFTLTTGPVTGGTPSYDIDSSTVVLNDTTDRVIIDNSTGVLDRYLFTAVSDVTGCTDEDLRIYMIYYHPPM